MKSEIHTLANDAQSETKMLLNNLKLRKFRLPPGARAIVIATSFLCAQQASKTYSKVTARTTEPTLEYKRAIQCGSAISRRTAKVATIASALNASTNLQVRLI